MLKLTQAEDQAKFKSKPKLKDLVPKKWLHTWAAKQWGERKPDINLSV